MATPKQTNLTEDEFVDRFKPEEDKDGNVQRELFNDVDLPLLEAARSERRLWTAVEGDSEKFVITSRYHYVNQIYHIICQVPHPEDEEFTVV